MAYTDLFTHLDVQTNAERISWMMALDPGDFNEYLDLAYEVAYGRGFLWELHQWVEEHAGNPAWFMLALKE